MTSVSEKASETRFSGAGATNAGGVASDAKIAAKIANMPVSCRKTYRRAMTGKSLRAAVNAFCTECVGYEREEVRRCTSATCPLYPYRPFQQGGR